MTEQATTTDELAFIRPYGEQEKQILTAEAVEFLTELVTHFTPQRNKLLAARIQQQQDIEQEASENVKISAKMSAKMRKMDDLFIMYLIFLRISCFSSFF